ncbi:hypothetical protein BH23VER1_BH23VER1_11690 [soil metagenome]
MGSVAVGGAAAPIAPETFTSDRSHNSQLFAPLGRVLAAVGGAAGLRGGTIVVGTGPGSYTGIRVGIAAAQALALAAGTEVMGVPSACAADTGIDDYWLCGDARRGAFFLLQVLGRQVSGDPELVEAAALPARLDLLYAAGAPVLTFDPVPPAPGVGVARPLAENLIRAAGSGSAGDGGAIEPIYLRSPYVTQPKD